MIVDTLIAIWFLAGAPWALAPDGLRSLFMMGA